MIIQKMRCYFLYNVPVTEHLLSSKSDHAIGVTPQLIEKFKNHFNVEKAVVPSFYTSHYHHEHTPYFVADPAISHQTYIPAERLQTFDFFNALNLGKNIVVNWDFMLALQTTGLITICLEVSETQASHRAYHLSGLHLNPDYTVIATEPIKGLWKNIADERPEFITLDQLAQIIRQYFFETCGLTVRRVQALRHEIQIPFTTIEVETESTDQAEFVKNTATELAEFVFKPACWEVEHGSAAHAKHILSDSRVWTVAQDTYVVVSYEGALYVKIRTFDTGVPHEVSGFKLADESSVLHSFKLAVSNYHLLRILDDLLDLEVAKLKEQVSHYQKLLDQSFDDPTITDTNVLQEMNRFVIQVTNLEFQLVDLLEELDNSDKLIDEEWHIVLLDKLNDAFGVKMWRDSLNGRVTNLNQLVQTIEDAYERFLSLNLNKTLVSFNEQLLEMNIEDKKVEERLKWVGYLFGVLAVAEVIGLLIDVGFDDNNPLIQRIANGFGLNLTLSHDIGVVGIILIMILIFVAIIWWENRSVAQLD